MPPSASELHLVLQRLAQGEVPDVLQGGGGDVAQRLLREVGLVGGDDDVVERQQARQRVVVDNLVRAVFVEVLALLLVDIQSGRSDLFVFQSFDEGVGVDELSAAGVDDHHAVLHLADGVVVDEVLRLLRQGAVQGDDVRAVVELVECGIDHLVLAGKVVVGIEVVGQYVHAEAAEDADELLGYLARADDARRLAVHVEAQQAVQGEVAVARAPRGAVDFAVEREHQRHGVLRHGVGRVGGHANHRDAALGGGLQVDVVVARAAQGQQLDAVCGHQADDFGVGRVVHEDADHVHALRQDDVVLVQVTFVETEFETELSVFLVERSLVVGLRAEECDCCCHDI